MRRTVQDVMTREVVAVRGPTPFKELVRLLNEHRPRPCRCWTARTAGGRGRLRVRPRAEGGRAAARGPHPAFETAQHRGERANGSLTAAELMTAPAVTVGPESRSRPRPGACTTAASSGCRWSTTAAPWSASSPGRTC